MQGDFVRFTSRCWHKGCKCVISIRVPAKIKIQESLFGTHKTVIATPEYDPNRTDSHYVFCIKHRNPVSWRMIEGKVIDNHKCDDRCLGAKGFVCNCSCGGKNHGAGFGTLKRPILTTVLP